MYTQNTHAAQNSGMGILPLWGIAVLAAPLFMGAIYQQGRASEDPHGAAFPWLTGERIPDEVLRPLPPAAPQSKQQMTVPQAWTPEILFSQTARERELFNQGIRAGSTGNRTPTAEKALFEQDWFLYGALAVGAVIAIGQLR